jgi:hypothetical protein
MGGRSTVGSLVVVYSGRMAGTDVRNVRAIADPEVIEAYEAALLGMARRVTGNPSLTLAEAEAWHDAERIARGSGPSPFSSVTAPTTS